MPNVPPVHLRDPAALSRFIEIGEKVRRDACYQRFKALVPSKLFDISSTLQMDYHADVARSMGAQDDGGRFGFDTKRRLFNCLQGVDEFAALVFRQIGQTPAPACPLAD